MTIDFFTPRRCLFGAVLITAVLGAGCANAPVPEAQLALGRSAINDAITAGAAESAPLELQQAREKMAQAEAAVAAENHTRALHLAEEAELDARLAAARTRSARTNQAALEIEKSIRVLREGLGTDSSPPRP